MISIPSASASYQLPGNSTDRKFPRETFVNIMQLIDVCLLDVESLRYVFSGMKVRLTLGTPEIGHSDPTLF